jgi:phosphonate transport system permease protein
VSTTVGSPAPPAPTPPTSSVDDVSGQSARAILARREPRSTQIVRLLILLLSVVVLIRGWVVTDIDLAKLANAPNAGPILKALVTPDVFARDITQTELRVPFQVGPEQAAPVEASTRTGQSLKVIPGSAQVGDSVELQGAGFEPGAEAQLRLDFGTGRTVLLSRIPTDDSGKFDVEITWPPSTTAPPGTYTLQLLSDAPSGSPHLSETMTTSLSRIGETILLALMGTVFGVILSVPFSFLGARNLMGGSAIGMAIYSVVRTFFTITRSIEVLILGVIMVVIVGIGSFAGVLAIVVHSIGSLGKLYSEAIESIEPGPVEAITATGANRFQTVLFGVIPQVIPEFLAVTIFWWDHNVRMSTVLGLVGGGGIGYLLIQYIQLLQYNQSATVLWMIVAVVTAMDYASAAIRARLV